METKDIKLPLTYSSHRQIMDADRNLVIEVFSGGPGIEAADQLQELVVVACNSHEQLVKALRDIASQSTGADWTAEQALDFIKKHARVALAAAGAA